MKYLPLLLVLFLVAACSENNSSGSDDDSTRFTQNPNNNIDELLKLFPELTSLTFDEALFRKNEGGGSNMIPYALDNKCLGGNHEGYESDEYVPESIKSAIGKIRLGENWGLFVMKRQTGADGRQQTYLLYTVDVEGQIIAQESVAASIGWQGGYIHQTGSLERDGENWAVTTMYNSVVDAAEYDKKESALYEKECKEVIYGVKTDGQITVNEQVLFEVQAATDEQEAVYKSFEHFKNLKLSSEGIPNWKNIGQIQNGLAWSDKNGDNYVFFAYKTREDISDLKFVGKEASATLHMRHYIVKDGKGGEFVQLNDYEALCDFDLYTGFIYPSFEITDLDKDGIAELTFMYSLGCISDVSPIPVKLMLYENGEKYVFRGRSRVSHYKDMKPDYAVGPVGRSFKDNSIFFEFAKEHWEKFA